MSTTTVLLPCHYTSLERIADHVPASQQVVVVLSMDSSRFVWREICPCIFPQQRPNSNDKQQLAAACHMMHVLYSFFRKHKRLFKIYNNQSNSPRLVPSSTPTPEQDDDDDDDDPSTLEALFFHRELPLLPNKRFRKKYTFLILPWMETKIEYAWEERLIHLEHDRIQKQSIAGFYSTLGGGYFMTRRLQTANTLAVQQKRIAAVLGNKEMYYKCTINQAYSEIYRGRFRMARLHILQVWVALAHETHFDEKQVLKNMCRSCMWFRKQVRDARRHVAPGASRLVDDFSRIRVVQDQSSHQDLQAVAPSLARVKV